MEREKLVEMGRMIARNYPDRVGEGKSSRPSRVTDVQRAAKVVAKDQALNEADTYVLYLAAMREAAQVGLSTAGMGR